MQDPQFHNRREVRMRRLPAMVELVLGLLLLAHAILAFTKWRWVTGLLEVVCGVALVMASRGVASTRPSVADPARV
jgi:uncharacterized membrane protein HdeD (DUF308 family)